MILVQFTTGAIARDELGASQCCPREWGLPSLGQLCVLSAADPGL